jgi:hypothetical protein
MAAPDPTPLRALLDGLGEKPPASAAREIKKGYAERMSREIALLVANSLRGHYPRANVTPRPDGTAQEFTLGGGITRKRVDVGVRDDAAGLVLGVSVKTYNFQDWDTARQRAGRYTKNVKRNDMELRDEADTLHRRQPYAVLYAVFFEPMAAASDGKADRSSFAHAVVTFRSRQGRVGPDSARYDLFERVFVGLFEEEGERRGTVGFFDVSERPPRNAPPRSLITLDELIASMARDVDLRNGLTQQWAEDDKDH